MTDATTGDAPTRAGIVHVGSAAGRGSEDDTALEESLAALRRIVEGAAPVVVAVSGGVDSLTLATLAGRSLGDRVLMAHATSPAVPAEATARVRALAAGEGWRLDVFDAGEFADPAYRQNPHDRCFFCKTNLYGTVRRRAAATAPGTAPVILSGANTDDLGEYRPGLDAARLHGVRHPYVEAGIGKATVRALARRLGLGRLAELPAAPCLSSRVETGIAIDPMTLTRVHAAERLVAARVAPATVRCRVRAAGVVIELDPACLGRLDPAGRDALRREVAGLFDGDGGPPPVALAPYRNGSAFLRPSHVG